MVESLLTQFEAYDRKIFWTMLVLTGLVMVAYLYFLSVSVYAVIGRRTAERDLDKLSAKISVLESQYVSLDKRISLDMAHAQGFMDIAVPRYISRGAARDTFTLRNGNDAR